MKKLVLWFDDCTGYWWVLRGSVVLYESRYYLDAYSVLCRFTAAQP